MSKIRLKFVGLWNLFLLYFIPESDLLNMDQTNTDRLLECKGTTVEDKKVNILDDQILQMTVLCFQDEHVLAQLHSGTVGYFHLNKWRKMYSQVSRNYQRMALTVIISCRWYWSSTLKSIFSLLSIHLHSIVSATWNEIIVRWILWDWSLGNCRMFNGLECDQTSNDDTSLTGTIFLLTQSWTAGPSPGFLEPVFSFVMERERARAFRR